MKRKHPERSKQNGKHGKRVKMRSYKALYKQARAVFSKWIVNRDPICFCCGNPSKHASHYIHRNCFDFSEIVNHGCCISCNVYLHGNLGVYALKMIDLYGYDAVQQLHRQSHEVVKFSREFLEEVIKKYSFEKTLEVL